MRWTPRQQQMDAGALAFILSLCALTLLKLTLILPVPIMAIADAGHDDQLFVQLASYFNSSAGWLGRYNELTLIKGPIYPLWIALCFKLGIPLFFGQHLLYAVAGLLLTAALRQLGIGRIPLLLLFGFYLFNPEFSLRVIREGIYPALTVISIAGAIGMHAKRDAGAIQFAAWSLLTGVGFTALWMTREEGVWLLPTLLLLVTYTIYRLYREQGSGLYFLKRALLGLLPFLITVAGIQAIAMLNQAHYCMPRVVEVNSKPFTLAYGSLLRVVHPEPKGLIHVPEAVRKKIYPVSPAFRELEPFLEKGPLDGWKVPGCELYPRPCDDYTGGWFLWALRSAATKAGYHRSGAEAYAYYTRLAEEIRQACDADRLECGPLRATIVPQIRLQHLDPILSRVVDGYVLFTQYRRAIDRLSQPVESSGHLQNMALFEKMLYGPIAPLRLPPSPVPMYQALGWLSSPGDTAVSAHVRTASGKPSPSIFRILPQAPDKDPDAQSARDSGKIHFEIIGECPPPGCRLTISGEHGELATQRFVQGKPAALVLSPGVEFGLDKAKRIKSGEVLRAVQPVSVEEVKVLRLMANAYHLCFAPMLVLAFVAFIANLGSDMWRRELTFTTILQLAIFGAVLARMLILAIVDVTMYPAIDTLYMSPLYPLAWIFIVVSMNQLLQRHVSNNANR